MHSVPESRPAPTTEPAPSRWVTVLAVGATIYSVLLVFFSLVLVDSVPGRDSLVVPLWGVASICALAYVAPMGVVGILAHWRAWVLLITAFFLGFAGPLGFLMMWIQAGISPTEAAHLLGMVATFGTVFGGLLALLTGVLLPLSRYRWPRFALWFLTVAATACYLVATTIAQRGTQF
ncbi:hypothetical protein J4H86_12965 [Spiractinospora alimapuensis]|uniref:hypothetical protein n=1 Tax=Spiractinospora alimapuensis TaxID=2820884 RepID=UPI001F3A21D7|nr:hypothetical protein [Spiractinospora alimapuensis]QVQ54490.1 hypothetical protein J4H86_12965 [Spiractinospora alimapuensis]